ncbi:MAG: carbamoyltransferase HypF, partial [Planctomycetes bacterium]|nr:carbamoyltransferase HypF [Planctomycetota bacterium]
RLEISGRVQGVGFRPFLFRLASALELKGCIGNDSRGAFAEIEGPERDLDAFSARLRSEAPPLARVRKVDVCELPPLGETGLRIAGSALGDRQDAEISPDVATCDACLRELWDPADRRHRYPFINCTNCGPRYSIIRAVPYDRPRTTMAAFAMCPRCQAEYADPRDRRFHAQPDACAECGPRLWMADASGAPLGGDPIEGCARRLQGGAIAAIKGLGGFHLACRADRDDVVARLRERKAREAKPLALMVGSIEEARSLAHVDARAEAALLDPRRPIVLIPRRAEALVSRHVAPAGDCLGLMLPYTPVHALLFAEGLGPLVMTSGNPSEEPLSHRNDEAIRRLGSIADIFLLHDRDIERPIDDSVVILRSVDADDAGGAGADATDSADGANDAGDAEDADGASYAAGATARGGAELGGGAFIPLRRARGFVPAPLDLEPAAPVPLLAVGGDLKSAVCLAEGSRAVLSEHLGDLENPAAYRHFAAAVDRLAQLLVIEPRAVACDLHPAYLSRRYALSRGLPSIEVQHHHAHVVSCLADNGERGRVVGISCDGTGYGTDGAVWGGEILVADEIEFRRAAHLRYLPLLGGDAAARETWRPAAALLHAAFGESWTEAAAASRSAIEGDALRVASARLSAGGSLPATSSLGRLFDAAAFILGLAERNRYEAEAAMALEAAARGAESAEPLDYLLAEQSGGLLEMDTRPLARSLLDRVRQREDPARLALAFHLAVIDMLSEAAIRIAESERLDRAALSGGCFANRILLEGVRARLEAAGLRVLIHQSVPPGDGGLALGQAACAAARLARGEAREADPADRWEKPAR